jgi:hypothetical protein
VREKSQTEEDGFLAMGGAILELGGQAIVVAWRQ